ncbi:MAG: cache domain-containing protein, partial [Pseudomonadota bacterium]|nr:cache domain-containing protein [Pseudomonadota bacterium]
MVKILSRLGLGTKMALLLGLSATAMLAIAGIGAMTLYQRMFDDRVDKLRSVISSASSIAAQLEASVNAHEMTRQQALDRFHQDIRSIRFDGGTGYLFAVDAHNGNVLMHGVNPKLEGKPFPNDPATGQPISDMLIAAVRSSDSGITSYMFPKPSQTQPLQKVAAVARIPAWDMVIGTGAYIDDLDAAFNGSMLKTGLVGGAILLFTMLVARLVTRDVTVSLG